MLKWLLYVAAILWGTGYAISQVPSIWRHLAWLVPLIALPTVLIRGAHKLCKANPGNPM